MAGFWAYILFVADGKPNLLVLITLFFLMGFLAMSHILAFTDMTHWISIENSGLASSIVNAGEFLGSSVLSLIIGFMLDKQWQGSLVDGVRYYEPSSYRIAFMIFFITALIGILTSFIGVRKKHSS